MTSLGIIAEDETDCETLTVLARRILPAGIKLGMRCRNGSGGSLVRRKAGVWMQQLAKDGCSGIVLVHDLDRDPKSGALNDEATLRAELSKHQAPAGILRIVCIPVEEIEAWFWCDPAILKRLGDGKTKASSRPHAIKRPKEALMHASRDAGKKPRYSTNDNPALASKLDLDLCAKSCGAFAGLRAFVLQVAANAPPPRPRAQPNKKRG